MLKPEEFARKLAEFRVELEGARSQAHDRIDEQFDRLKNNGEALLAMLDRDTSRVAQH